MLQALGGGRPCCLKHYRRHAALLDGRRRSRPCIRNVAVVQGEVMMFLPDVLQSVVDELTRLLTRP
jgi:hypothetical protein